MANTSGAEALRELRENLATTIPESHMASPVTWGELLEIIHRAERSVEQLEYERYMGEDM